MRRGKEAPGKEKEEVGGHLGKWATMEQAVQLLRELAVQELVCGNSTGAQLPGDPEDIQCSPAVWQKVVQSAPPSYASKLAVLDLGGEANKAPTVREVATQLRQLEEHLSSPLQTLVSAVESLPDVPELQRELRAKVAQWYATIHISNAMLSIPLAPECRPHFAFTWRGVQYTWNRLPPGWKYSPAICHSVVKDLLEKSGAPEHLLYVDDIIVWGDTADEVFERGNKILGILLASGFAVSRSGVKGPRQQITFLGVRLRGGRRLIPRDVVNKIRATSPPTSGEEMQEFLDVVGSWQMHIPNYSHIVAPLCQVASRRNIFRWGPAQQQAFEQVKQEITHAMALGTVRVGQDVTTVLYTAAGEKGPTWSLWQKVPREARGQPLGFWSRGYQGSESCYTLLEKEILAAYEGIQAAAEVVGPEAQLLLAPQIPLLYQMFQGKVPSTRYATDATWSTWTSFFTQQAQAGNPRILEVILEQPKGNTFGMPPEEVVTHTEETTLGNELPGDESDEDWVLQPLGPTVTKGHLVSQH